MRVLVYGDIGGSGGYVRYCRGLFGDQSIPGDLEITFVCASQFYEQLKPLDNRIRVITHSWPAGPSRVRRYLWHLVVYPKIVHHIRPDVEFFPSGQLRVYGRRTVSIAACHNLLLFDEAEMQRLKSKPEYRGLARYRDRYARSLSAASGVIFFSEHSRQMVRQALTKVPRNVVIGHGLEDEFRIPEPRAYELTNAVKILYVSSIWPYKNHAEVIEAVREVRQITRRNLMLSLVGGGPAGALTDLRALVKRANADSYVEVVGEVSHAVLLSHYHKADIFVFASTCESFGITLLEAMGARLPIACSNRSGLNDMVRDAAVYFDPSDAASIAAALLHLLGSSNIRRQLGKRAFSYSQAYTWDRCRKETYAFIYQVQQCSSTLAF